MSQPATRDLITAMWANTGGWHTSRRMAPWLGRPAAEIRQELERMESDGLAARWREHPGDEWRFGPPDEVPVTAEPA